MATLQPRRVRIYAHLAECGIGFVDVFCAPGSCAGIKTRAINRAATSHSNGLLTQQL